MNKSVHVKLDLIYIVQGKAPCADHLVARGAIKELSKQIQIQLGTMWPPFVTMWNPTVVI